MKLLLKFNLLLVVVFGLGLALIALEANAFLNGRLTPRFSGRRN